MIPGYGAVGADMAVAGYQDREHKSHPVALHLLQTDKNHARGNITLSSLWIPNKTLAGVRLGERSPEYFLSLAGSDMKAQVSVHGMLDVSLDGMGMSSIDFKYPQAIELQSQQDELEFIFRLSEETPLVFAPKALVSDLSFSQIDVFSKEEATLFRRFSTVTGVRAYRYRYRRPVASA